MKNNVFGAFIYEDCLEFESEMWSYPRRDSSFSWFIKYTWI